MEENTDKRTPLEVAIKKYAKVKKDNIYINEKSAELALFICHKFEEIYPNIDFELRYRIKTDQSMKRKLLKLEAERLEDLYFIDELNEIDLNYFKQTIENKYIVLKGMSKTNAQREVEKIINRKKINYNKEKKSSLQYIKEKGRNPKKPEEYLRLFDIVGIKLIIKKVPKGYKTVNEDLNGLIAQRDCMNVNSEEYSMLDDKIQYEIAKKFMDKYLLKNETLEKLNLYSIKERRKDVLKENGYKAVHVALEDKDNPNRIYEFQIRTKYVEKITHEGIADHSKRFGKDRKLPKNALNKEELKQLQDSIPQYILYRPGMKELYKCNFIENTYYYYRKEFTKDSTLLDKLWNIEISVI